MKIIITLHVYLFLRQLIKNCSTVLTCLNCILEKKLKSSKKINFCVESKAKFLVELKHSNSKSSFALSLAKAKHGHISETYENLSWLGMRNGA